MTQVAVFVAMFDDAATAMGYRRSVTWLAGSILAVSVVAPSQLGAEQTRPVTTGGPYVIDTIPADTFALRYEDGTDFAWVPDHAALDPTGPFTVEVRVKPLMKTDTFLNFLVSKNINLTGYHLLLNNEDGTKYPTFKVESASNTDALSPTPLVAGVWSTVSGVWDNGRTRLYVNGALMADVASPDPVTPNDIDLFLGSSLFGGGTYLRGELDEVRIWNRALSTDEILAGVGCHLTGDEVDLIAYWPFREGTGLISVDVSGNSHDARLGDGGVFGGVTPPTWVATTEPPVCPILFRDGFETGGVSRWSANSP